MFLEFLKSRIVYCLLVFLHPSLRDSFFRTQCKVHIPYISHESRYSLDQKKVSSRSRLGHSRVSSRSRLGKFGKRLGLVSVSGAQVSVLVSVSTQKVLGPSLERTSLLSIARIRYMLKETLSRKNLLREVILIAYFGHLHDNIMDHDLRLSFQQTK